jgi:hypothetical protein
MLWLLTRAETAFTFIIQSYYIAFSGGCIISDNDYWCFMEIKVSKKLILGMVLSLLLVSGSFFSVQAACDLGSNDSSPNSFTCSLWGSRCDSRDADRDTVGKHKSPAASQGSSYSDTNRKDGISSDSGRTRQ